jgi:MFS family permease
MSNPQSTSLMPDGIGNAYRFQVFNSLSFSLIIGTPLLLFFKKLDASVTVLGIVAALPPLLNIMQIPAARFVEQVGYRAFVLKGWTIRSVFILGAAGVAFLPAEFNATTRMMLMLVLMFLYNLSRGISVCGLLPWITQLVPSEHRAHFLSRDQICGFSAITAGSILCGFWFKANDGMSGFGLIFLVSFAAAVTSLYFLKRMPDVEISTEKRSKSKEPVPWMKMLNYQPFKRILIFNMVMLLAWAGNGVLVIPLLRDRFEVSDSLFMYLNASWGVVFIIALLIFGKVSDWSGSKPVLSVSLFFQMLHFGGWGLVAAEVIPFNYWTMGVQQVTWGLSFALFNVANMRMIMGIVPEMGRSHFFALFSVCTSLTVGIVPVFWGMAADGMLELDRHWGGVSINAFSVLYFGVMMLMVAAAFCLRQVEELNALTSKAFFNELVRRTPARAIPRLFPRRLWP